MTDVQRAQARNVAGALAFAALGWDFALLFMLGWYVALTTYATACAVSEVRSR